MAINVFREKLDSFGKIRRRHIDYAKISTTIVPEEKIIEQSVSVFFFCFSLYGKVYLHEKNYRFSKIKWFYSLTRVQNTYVFEDTNEGIIII